jgi:hypothetical protein
MQQYEIALLSLGLTPFIIMLVAAAGVGIGMLYKLFSPEDLTTLLLLIGGVWLFVVLVLLFITSTCGAIRPRELFANVDGSATAADPYQALITGITLAETDVCLLMTRADQFVISSVSMPGADNKVAAVNAIEVARAPTGGVMTVCPSTWPKTITDHDAVLGEAANRLARMESTLKNYTEPQLLKTYKAVVPCESFVDDAAEEQRLTVLGQLNDRLATINDIVTAQKKNLLRPVDNKQKELKAGHASDCDKAKGAKYMAKNASSTSMLMSS